MNLNVTGPFIYFTIPIFGGIDITQTTVSSLLVTIFICVMCVTLGKNLSTRPGPRQAMVEKGVLMMRDLVVSTMGAHNEHWTPFILTLFLSSLFGSLIGMTGFLRSSTADLSCTLVWALMVSGIIWYNNIKNNGFAGWLKGFTEPIAAMTPMNIISEFAQPISMAFRHFGNVVSGSVISTLVYAALAAASTAVLGLLSGTIFIPVIVAVLGGTLLVKGIQGNKLLKKILGMIAAALGVLGILGYLGIQLDIPVLQAGIPAVLSVYFDLFSSAMQAFIFCMLTTLYIANAAEG